MGAPDGHNPTDPELLAGSSPGRPAFDRALSDLTDDARREAARADRQERQDRAVVAGLSATFLGTLVELCESNAPVVLVTVGGSHHRGVISLVGADVVVVATSAGHQRSLLAPAAIEAIRELGPGHSRAVHAIDDGPRMGELLDELAVDRRVAIGTIGGNRFMGRLLRVGVDQVTLQLDGERDALTVPLAAIAEAVIDP